METYLDTSLLVSLFTTDALTERARAFIRTSRPTVVVSDFAVAEFSAVIARLTRTGSLETGEARAVLHEFDVWLDQRTRAGRMEPADLRIASVIIRRFDIPLLAPDAIHIAIAQRLAIPLATFDRQMAMSAAVLGVPVADA